MIKTINLPKYDAELNTDVCDEYNNAELKITLKLGFRQINPPAGAATGTYHDYGDAVGPTRKIIKWTTGEWSAWKRNFAQSAERYWRDKFWLSNNAGRFAYRAGKLVFVPNFWCRFSIIGSNADVGTHHHVIDVVRLDSTETRFGSHSKLYDNLDTKPIGKGTDSKGKTIMQQAHIHEVGHLLGLRHVDVGKPHCPATGNTNAIACYGITDFDQNSVMGQGMVLRTEHASAWLTAAYLFNYAEGPSKIYTPPMLRTAIYGLSNPFEAKMSVHYTRTTEEFEKNLLITKKPVRML
jgi:hypothetical protein